MAIEQWTFMVRSMGSLNYTMMMSSIDRKMPKQLVSVRSIYVQNSLIKERAFF